MTHATRNAVCAPPQHSVIVACSARLHMGFLDPGAALGRRFGSIGLALDGPETRVVVRHAPDDSVDGPERERAASYLASLREGLGLAACHRLVIEKAIPAHTGLGSGTQLALAIGAALRRLHGLPADPRADARLLDRGARSGIGIALFEQGGLVVDGGHGTGDAPPPAIARLAVPDDWRILLVQDRRMQGLSGTRETTAFAALPEFDSGAAALLCHLVLMQILPALAEGDLQRFGDGITALQHHLGTYFAPVQGGPFRSPRVAAVMAVLAQSGAVGIGQSSWGPTGFAFVRGDDAAQACLKSLRGQQNTEQLTLSVQCPRNVGATISVA
jgi:beta-ribofuranosylaminobenzene 5'-phosphate synthase